MNRNKIIIVISWTIVILWMALIFNLSSQPAVESNKLSKGVTKVIVETARKVAPNTSFDVNKFNHILRKNAHFFAYLILGILIMNAMRRSGIKSIKAVLLICIIYAISDEIHQYYVPGRGPLVKDVLIDSVGAYIGVLVYLGLKKMMKNVLLSRLSSI